MCYDVHVTEYLFSDALLFKAIAVESSLFRFFATTLTLWCRAGGIVIII